MIGWLTRLRRGTFVLVLAGAALLALAIINEVAYQRSAAALQSLGDRGTARSQINLMLRRVLDAETAVRGFVLTDRKEYLEPYDSATSDVTGALEWLRKFYVDERSRLLIDEIGRGVNAKLAETALTLKLFNEGNQNGWRELMLTDIGREKMEAVRSATEQLLALEAQRVADERAQIDRSLRMGRLGIDATLLLFVVALWLYARQALLLERARIAHAQLLAEERDRLEAQVRHRTAELTQLARHLQNAREDERARLARELHDELGALLTAAKLDAARMKHSLGTMSPEVSQRFTHLVGAIDQVIALKRRIIEDLRPSSLSHLGLVAALEIHAREFAARAEVKVKTKLEQVPLPESAQITTYRLVQECFTNIAKYSGAGNVEVSLGPDGNLAHVRVSDDGRGFDPAAVRAGAHGLTGMRYRVEAEGGRLTIDAAPGRGTCVQAWLPVSAEAAQAAA
ncbi:MAG TPA: CHASE3 domain-containing protein [Burkholderiaceae bacterium]|jgi:signal transduction histidine kinase|nr:CHASE3 domain-containing protein [Burkholderiaceae bacterium]